MHRFFIGAAGIVGGVICWVTIVVPAFYWVVYAWGHLRRARHLRTVRAEHVDAAHPGLACAQCSPPCRFHAF